ncbi:MAG: glycosyltransferase family 2 protein [Candidatus Aminicenantes bacterium]|nr:glycosyltransferase family 2 protein [Candidatus Aminicenantes bacterium]
MKKEINPEVTIIIPCFNEAEEITSSLKSLVDEYVRYQCEILIIDGNSTDNTREIVADLARKEKLPIKIIDNPRRYQVFGLNIGIKEARGRIIVRADAHCRYPQGYVKRCVALLKSTRASNAGGIMRPVGRTKMQNSVALAMRHPLGVGDARFHLGNYRGDVDTVYLGTFWKHVLKEAGGFDPRCRTNEDAELNLRILKAGGRIYLDDRIKVDYYPRKSLRKLSVQYFYYGRGRCYTTLKHRRFTSLRQVAPVVLILFLLSSIVLGFFYPLFFSIPFLYGGTVMAVSLLSNRGRAPFIQRLFAGLAMLIMHTFWGAGFLSYFFVRKRRS